ncbi:hypothetical protein EVAR_94453_1 [Eumeta japonica]|uniref:Uncharacterized protein n=1 Tax=Eumeta variegata TaxID=151549 RepID=A0A4C1ZR87_EUMVA|nr:hypothetical protein EVAR_94453_1 [Eumeta japonica]
MERRTWVCFINTTLNCRNRSADIRLTASALTHDTDHNTHGAGSRRASTFGERTFEDRLNCVHSLLFGGNPRDGIDVFRYESDGIEVEGAASANLKYAL